MKIIQEASIWHKYALEAEYDQSLVTYCQFLKESFGFQSFSWDAETRKWRFSDPTIVGLIREKFPAIIVEPDVEMEVGAALQQEEKAQQIKEGNQTLDLEIPGIKGELYPYQKLGVSFFINSNGRALLADEMGTGKTVQSLAYIVHSKFKRTLVISPASVKFVWAAEVSKWTNLKSFVVDAKTDITLVPYDVEVVIINYDILRKFYNELLKYKWDCLIADEAHYCKAQNSIRSKIVKALAKDIPHILLLSGTPILNRVIEIFNLLNLLDPLVWNNWYKFAIRYAGGQQTYWGFQAKGSSNLDELKQKISKYFLRRTKEEVLSQLPPKVYIDIPMDLPREDRGRYELAENNLVKYLKEYKKNKTDKEIVKSLHAEKLVRLNILREVNVMGKLVTTEELIRDIIATEKKVIVFSSFNAPLIELSEEFEEESVLLLGETPVDERQELVRKFQENPDTKIFFSGIKSGGVGLTLTAASNVIFIDRSWVPSDHSQAESRAHRIGQEAQSVNIYTITSRDSIDDFMVRLLKKKQAVIDKVIEGDEEFEEESMINQYIQELQIKYKEI